MNKKVSNHTNPIPIFNIINDCNRQNTIHFLIIT